MTKRELIYTVYERLNIENDDTNLTEEFVSSLLDSTRAKIIKQTYGNKGWNAPIAIKQELCLGLTPASTIDGETCVGSILRSDDVLPLGISIKGQDGAVLSVKSYDRTVIRINMIPMERLPFAGADQYTAGMLFGALDVDRRLYFVSQLKGHLLLGGVKVEGIYEKPEDAYSLACINPENNVIPSDSDSRIDTPVYPHVWDVEYPLESAMQDDLINIIIQDLAGSMNVPSDTVNDSTDDIPQMAQQRRRQQ